MPISKSISQRDEPLEFSKIIQRATRWAVNYFDHPEAYPVLSPVKPGEIAVSLPKEAPEKGRSYDEIFDDFEKKILPGITHWNHPSFFAYFAISGSYPGILGEYLSAVLNVNGMLWRTSPALTELEEVSLGYLRDMLGLQSSFFGIILDTASTSSLLALAAAREALEGFNIREKGMLGRNDVPVLVMYMSAEAHTSIEKAAIVLGIGQENVRRIAVDEYFCMDPIALQRNIEQDIAGGRKPFCVVATVGTTSTTSIDPVPEIARICRKFDLWLHVDAAYAGIAAILPEKKDTLAGCNDVDSLVVNPHKWLVTPIDLSAFYCKRPDILKNAFSLVPEYLRSEDESSVTNLMDYGFQLGRRFRALKLWMVINYYGRNGLESIIREHIRLAGLLLEWIEKSDVFEIAAPAPFSTICFRLNPGKRLHNHDDLASEPDVEVLNRMNEALLNAVNASGRVFLSHTKLDNNFVLRCAIGHMRTTEEHIKILWEILSEKSSEILGK